MCPPRVTPRGQLTVHIHTSPSLMASHNGLHGTNRPWDRPSVLVLTASCSYTHWLRCVSISPISPGRARIRAFRFASSACVALPPAPIESLTTHPTHITHTLCVATSAASLRCRWQSGATSSLDSLVERHGVGVVHAHGRDGRMELEGCLGGEKLGSAAREPLGRDHRIEQGRSG
jgi:hypothetical protein